MKRDKVSSGSVGNGKGIPKKRFRREGVVMMSEMRRGESSVRGTLMSRCEDVRGDKYLGVIIRLRAELATTSSNSTSGFISG
jgi:hypothetical protein